MNRETKLKIIKICLIIIAIVAVLFAIGVTILKYQVEGEKNLPFKISKIIIVSSSEGKENEDTENRWNLTINQNNDIYIYIDKNDDYSKTEIINNIKLDNFNIQKESTLGTVSMYRPDVEGTSMFNNTEQNKINELIYQGDLESNIKNLQISNQGGLVVFRCANENIGKFISNEGDEIDYSDLLKTIEISKEDLNIELSFDITINLVNNKAYKATISLNMPADDIINNNTASIELTDLNNIIFKRIEN